jgi:hypothetical protein
MSNLFILDTLSQCRLAWYECLFHAENENSVKKRVSTNKIPLSPYHPMIRELHLLHQFGR